MEFVGLFALTPAYTNTGGARFGYDSLAYLNNSLVLTATTTL